MLGPDLNKKHCSLVLDGVGGSPEDAMSLEQMSTSLRTTPSGTTRRTKLSS